MAFDSVGTEARGRNPPESRYSGSTSFAFVAAMKRATGSPIRAAITPAVRLPRFPEGTAKTTGSPGRRAASR